jgi:hypothetical protein
MTLPVKNWNGRLLDALLHVLDRQIHDAQGTPMGVVDDLELEGINVGEDIPKGAAAPRVSALATGHVMITRILGGRPPESRLKYVGLDEVDALGVLVRLRPEAAEPDTLWLERWLRRWVIGRIPGGRHAPE